MTVFEMWKHMNGFWRQDILEEFNNELEKRLSDAELEMFVNIIDKMFLEGYSKAQITVFIHHCVSYYLMTDTICSILLEKYDIDFRSFVRAMRVNTKKVWGKNKRIGEVFNGLVEIYRYRKDK